MRILQRKNPNATPIGPVFDLNTPLLSLSPNRADSWTIGDSFEHTLVMGGTGSGKTSASGRTLALALMRAGYGGVVLCAKSGEAENWVRYAGECGRSASVIRFGINGEYRFNFLDYLMRLDVMDAGSRVDNAVNTFLRVLEAAHGSDGGGHENGDFWRKSMRELLSNAIGMLYHAYGRVTLDDIMKLINSCPISEEQAGDPGFQSWSFCYSTALRVFQKPAVALPAREAEQYVSYFGKLFGRLDNRTRSNIVITLSAEISPFMRGPLHRLFCTDTNVWPEAAHEGAIIILDLPIKVFEQAGVVAQSLFKYIWQKATERRAVRADTRPVFLFADEAQNFFSSYDLEFQSTARSSRAATVYLTQNLPSLYAKLGGRHPQDQADAIIGNFQTKIFHSNTDHRTNQWAAEMIGKRLHRRRSANWSHGHSAQTSEGTNGGWGVQQGDSKGRNWGSSIGGNFVGGVGEHHFSWGSTAGRQTGSSRSTSKSGGWSHGTSSGESDSQGGGWSEQMDFEIQPSFFANGLRQGGTRNGRYVSAVLVQANRIFSRTGSCWTPVIFKQD